MVDQPGRTGSLRFLLPLLAVVSVASLLLFFVDETAEESELDSNLCPADRDAITASAILLLDFQKPLHKPSSLGTLLHELSLGLDTGSELRILALTGNAEAPIRPVGNLCKPYDNTDLSVETAKDQRRTFRDCDDLPAQLAPDLRVLASRFCTRRSELEDRLNAMAAAVSPPPVANAYLDEALNETMWYFVQRPGAGALYIYSDMLQHADWYSQLELGWTGWRFEDFAAMRTASTGPLRVIPLGDLSVKIFYVPRLGLTEPPRARRVHQEFWRTYFKGAEVVFEEQPPLPQYAAVPLMNLPAQAESAARERESLQRQRQEAEHQLAAVAQEIEALKRQRERTAADEQERAERDRKLRRREQALEAERQRLREEEMLLAAASPANETPPTAPEDPGAPPETIVVQAPDAEALSRSTDLPPCGLSLHSPFDELLAGNRYPGNRRVNYGAATLRVRYTVDEQGATVDDEIELVAEASIASESRHFDALAKDTLDVVKSWEFSFEKNGEGACAEHQQRTATFTYVKKCRGAPMPSCLTVPSTVEYL